MFYAPGYERRDAVLRAAGLASVAKRLEGAHPGEILEWAVETYKESLTLSVSFGNAEGMVRSSPEVSVISSKSDFPSISP